MGNILISMDEKGRGSFYTRAGAAKAGEVKVCLSDSTLTVLRARISEQEYRSVVGQQILAALVDYAREHGLKMITLAPFARAHFSERPELYADLWER